MVDKIKSRLKSKFKASDRYANFGAFANKMEISGFRGIYCDIRFEYPVTAITGLNGAGKSTIGQLLLCAYKAPEGYKRWYIKDFFPVSIIDQHPFSPDAFVKYYYQSDKALDHSLTVRRARKEWSGYKRQPTKAALYIGLSFYLPKVERKDLTIYSAKHLELLHKKELSVAKHWAEKILGNRYDNVFFQSLLCRARSERTAELGVVERGGVSYSENNMGFGEGRVIHAIRVLESCPEKSLIVLEEPETSLHEDAQLQFAYYLMDVSFRRGHQIVFSTHSSIMISALPSEGRKLVSRDNAGVFISNRVSSMEIKNALNSSKEGFLIICVEDSFS